VTRAFALAVLIALAGGSAHAAPRDMCRSGETFRGAPLDLDVKAADIHDVMRLLADVGGVNIVVSDTVSGKVTLKLKRVSWDQVACTIAALHKLSIVADGNILLVRPRKAP
jgi:type IV pilus assembly protein PilQ